MSGYSFSSSPPTDWDRLCRESDALFGTGAWQELLERSFGCRTIYATNGRNGYAVSVFSAGPFRVGYLGFPVGSGIGTGTQETGLVDLFKSADVSGMPVCIRIPVSAFGQRMDLELPYQSNPETVIENLQQWKIESVSKNLRRDIRKAERSGLVISEVEDAAVGDRIYEMYFRTVKRHGGAVRYNVEYFRELIKLAVVQPRLRVMVATQDADIAGFVVIVRHANTAYYLHGGANPAHRKSSPSDLLLNNAIHTARQEGNEYFNLMASPAEQPTLIRYKEKWGGTTRDLFTYTLALRPSYFAFNIAEKVYRLVR